MKHVLPYFGDSSDEDDAENSRANFLQHRGNDVVQKELEFMEKRDQRDQ